MKNKKFLIFDFDGTIVDSTEVGLKRIELALYNAGLKKVRRSFLLHHWGKKIQDFFPLICQEAGDDSPDMQLFRYHYEKSNQEYDFNTIEIKKALENLKAFGYYLGIITSRNDKSLYEYLKVIDMPTKLFDFIQGADKHSHHKPSGKVFEPALKFAKNQQIEANEIMYFGDTVNYDLAASKDSIPQIDFIAVPSGVNTYQDFLKAGLSKNQTLKSIKDLPLYLNNMIKVKIEA